MKIDLTSQKLINIFIKHDPLTLMNVDKERLR